MFYIYVIWSFIFTVYFLFMLYDWADWTDENNNKWLNWPNNWAALWVLICRVHLTVLSFHIHVLELIYTLQFPECQGTLCLKQTGYLKFTWLQRDSKVIVRLRTRWLWVRIPLPSLKRYPFYFEQRVPWHSGNCRQKIHSEMCMRHDKNTKLNAPYRWVLKAQLYHLVNLVKWLSARLQTKWLWVRIPYSYLNVKYCVCFE